MDDSPASAAHLKDFRLAIEYKYLMRNAPGGVFIMPDFDDIRQFYGVIFVRRGLYRNGIFRFKMTLPKSYNSVNAQPIITFTPPIFNPLIDSETGVLDLRLDDSFKDWNPEKHFLVSALTFLKKIFYMKSFDNYPMVPDERARVLLMADKAEYLKLVEACVQESLMRADETDSKNTIIFTEPRPAHENLKRQIYSRESERGEREREISSTPGSTPGRERERDMPRPLADQVEDVAEKDERTSLSLSS